MQNNLQLKRIYLGSFIILMISAGIIASSPIVETDIFWHLAHGKYIIGERHVPTQDPFTYTAKYWQDVNHEWLSQIILALIDIHYGLRGLRVARAILVVLTLATGFVIFYLVSRRHDLSFLASALWWTLMQPNVSIRPHLFGWLSFLAVMCLLVNSNNWSVKKYVALFVISVVAINLHPTIVIVPILCAIYIAFYFAGLILEEIIKRFQRKQSEIQWNFVLKGLINIKPYFIVILISITAYCIQPSGIKLFSYVMATPGVNIGLNNEWLPFIAEDVWHYRPFLLITFFLIIILTLVVALYSRINGLKLFPGWAVGIFVLLMAVDARRMTFFVFVALVFSISWISRWVEEKKVLKINPFLALIVCTVILLSTLMITKRPDVPFFMEKDVLPNRFPEKACDFLEKVQLQGSMFNPTTWGGYLSYRLYPQYKVMCDGRWIIAGRDLVIDNIKFIHRKTNVEHIADRYQTDYLIQPMIDYIQSYPLDPFNWILIYNDKATVILLRRKSSKLKENLLRVCEFYDKNSEYSRNAIWPVPYNQMIKGITPFSIPSVLYFCKAGKQNNQ